MKKILSIILLLAITMTLFACAADNNNGSDEKIIQARVVTNSGQTKQMTLQEILDIADTNSLLFEKEYVGAKISVTSTITRIGGSFELTSWFQCEAFVELKSSDGMGCWFHPVREAYALTLNVGDKITVNGRIGMATVTGNDVYILYDDTFPYDPYGDEVEINTESNESIWIPKYYLDEYGKPTNRKYVTNKDYFSGTFRNANTTNAPLYVSMAIDRENREWNVAIFLYEYCKNLVTNTSGQVKEYDIILEYKRTGNIYDYSGIYHLKGYMYPGGDRIFVKGKTEDGDSGADVITLRLCDSGKSFRLHIIDANNPITEYYFRVYPLGSNDNLP